MTRAYRQIAGCHPERKHIGLGLCGACYKKKWMRENPEKYRILMDRRNTKRGHGQERKDRDWRYNLWYKYELTPEQYAEMLIQQDYRCAICGAGADSDRSLSVDHDHAIEEVRGLLCSYCNSLLGYARDNRATLVSAIEYLALWEKRIR